jgi:hypothetical protein
MLVIDVQYFLRERELEKNKKFQLHYANFFQELNLTPRKYLEQFASLSYCNKFKIQRRVCILKLDCQNPKIFKLGVLDPLF